MKGAQLAIGYMPLIDAAPLIVAHEIGFAAEESLTLDLRPAPSWSTLRDMLSFGQISAAHMLSPVPVATALGLGGATAPLSAVSVLSVNGNVIGVSRDLAAKLRGAGHDFGFHDAAAAGRALIDVSRGELRIGVPFPFSMHAELVFYWLSALGLPAPQGIDIRTVPPPLMAEALRAGEVDAFCVGEPWGSMAVEQGVAELLLPGAAIWAFAPEKVLAMRNDWINAEPDLRDRLIRACWRAGRWLADPSARMLAAEMLSRSKYLDLKPEILEHALSGRLVIAPDGAVRDVPGFVGFHDGVAAFPWRSHAEWIGRQLAARTGLDRDGAARVARSVFRSDLYRQALQGAGADLPSASSKVEGSLEVDTAVSAAEGRVILKPDLFFDGRVFEPDLS